MMRHTTACGRATRPRLGPLRPPPGWTALMLVAALGLAGCGDPLDPLLEVTGPTMGTFYSVKVARPPAELRTETLRETVTAVLDQVIAEISTYDPTSELSRLNADPTTDWVPVSAELLDVVAEGQRISELSGGAFDITVGPLVNLWGFGPEHRDGTVPDAAAIAAALERVGYDKLALRAEPPAIRKARGDIYIDLSALGEGQGAARVASALEARGVTDYMVAIAGAIRVRGHNAKGAPWAIAIEEPTPGRRSVHRIIEISDGALSTSGDYRNFFEEGGQRYSHEIDPKTGRPIAHSLASVTVVDADATRADGLATALMVMGEARGPALAEAEQIPAYFIVREDAGFRVVSTAAFQRYLRE
ncbi:FAD:protein FMN transferase ApbE [Thiococcus pfennigii]|nr:FAD:protein FMN transferase ApbE [Thiococcus pfennigii]